MRLNLRISEMDQKTEVEVRIMAKKKTELSNSLKPICQAGKFTYTEIDGKEDP